MNTQKALAGMKILDFTRVYSGPYCTMLLADMGAEVIKVEALGKGDETRAFYPIKDGESGYFMYLNRNKKSITLNLKAEEGKKAALELAKWADVIVENFSAGTIGRLGLGYEDVTKINPEVIYASISGFGQYGPYKNKLAYDAIAQAMGGLTAMTGFPDGPPVKVGPAISDAVTGVHTALAIMIASYYKMKTGKGQYIDVAMMDTVFSILENAVPIKTLLGEDPKRIGNSSPSATPYNVFKTKDGSIVIGTSNDSLFYKLATVMGREDLITDPKFSTNPARKEREPEVEAIVESWTIQHTSKEIEDILNERSVPVASIKTIGELVDDPHIAARNMLIEQDNPVVGKTKLPGNPLKLQLTPPDTSRRAPNLGEHTEEVLFNLLGYPSEYIQQLKDNHVI